MAVAGAPWEPGPEKVESWSSIEVSRRLLGEDVEYRRVDMPLEWAKICASRIREHLRNWMRCNWEGLEDERLGHLTDWILACAIARENCLLLGEPGVAKSEIAVQFFRRLSLKSPSVDDAKLKELAKADVFDLSWWTEREKAEREQQKYFHYLLSRFSQVEELFGPIELELLKKGIMARVNFGLLTGPGVRAAFLDEVFKASSSVLNTLLTLTQERTYFNRGGMVPSDLVMFIAASNEMPGGFATGMYGQGSGGEDFQTLHAFLDRFPIRIEIPNASGSNHVSPDKMETDLGKAFKLAKKREAQRFTTGQPFPGLKPAESPCINDILLLGRCCMQGLDSEPTQPLLFDREKLKIFDQCFINIGCQLQTESGFHNTFDERDTITWSVSPRKLRSLYKIALAHALVRDAKFDGDNVRYVRGPGVDSLRVFDMIWDSPVSRMDLHRRNDQRFREAKRKLSQ